MDPVIWLFIGMLTGAAITWFGFWVGWKLTTT